MKIRNINSQISLFCCYNTQKNISQKKVFLRNLRSHIKILKYCYESVKPDYFTYIGHCWPWTKSMCSKCVLKVICYVSFVRMFNGTNLWYLCTNKSLNSLVTYQSVIIFFNRLFFSIIIFLWWSNFLGLLPWSGQFCMYPFSGSFF